MMRRMALALLAASAIITARAETPEEWVTLGARVHGAFGAYIPVGIRIGLDALQQLDAKPREVTVLYFDSDKAPGARTMQLAPEKAPEGAMAVVVVRNKRTGAAVRYTVADTWIPKLAEWNRTLDPRARYDEVMKAENLFTVAAEK
jgi:hypothetical protein